MKGPTSFFLNSILTISISIFSNLLWAQELQCPTRESIAKELPSKFAFTFKAGPQLILSKLKMRRPVSQKKLTAFFPEAIRLIEEETGKKFKDPPTLVFKHISRLPNQDNHNNNAPAFYDRETNTIYFNYSTCIKLSVLLNFNKKENRDAYKIVMIHELTHALQRENMSALSYDNQFKIEGHATFVQERIAEKLGILNTHLKGLLLQTNLDLVYHKFKMPLDDTIIDYIARHQVEYAQGAKFFKQLYEQGQHQAVWDYLLDDDF